MQQTHPAYCQRLRARDLIRILLALSIFTVSFDIAGTVEISNLTLRMTQVCIFPLIVNFLFISICRNGKLPLPAGGKALLIWMLFQMAFIVRSPDLKNAIAYFFWLTFNVCVVFTVSYYTDIAYDIKWLLRTYIRSYVFISYIGILQFILFRVGIRFFITQTMGGRFGRINGLSYEPSYFATYLLMGIVFISYLVESGNSELFSVSKLRFYQYLMFITMILSSSRMGILVLGLWIMFRLMMRFGVILSTGKGPVMRVVLDLLLIGLLVIVAFWILPAFLRTHSFLLSGLGIGGTSTHSVHDRLSGLTTCVRIFQNSPIWGYSLGGVDPIIAQYRGIPYTGSNGSAMSIIGEILVANGIVGLLPLSIYLCQLLHISKRNFSFSAFRREVICFNPLLSIRKGLRYALCFELIILCMNQNILRSYLWMHIAIYSACRRAKDLSV